MEIRLVVWVGKGRALEGKWGNGIVSSVIEGGLGCYLAADGKIINGRFAVPQKYRKTSNGKFP